MHLQCRLLRTGLIPWTGWGSCELLSAGVYTCGAPSRWKWWGGIPTSEKSVDKSPVPPVLGSGSTKVWRQFRYWSGLLAEQPVKTHHRQGWRWEASSLAQAEFQDRPAKGCGCTLKGRTALPSFYQIDGCCIASDTDCCWLLLSMLLILQHWWCCRITSCCQLSCVIMSFLVVDLFS